MKKVLSSKFEVQSRKPLVSVIMPVYNGEMYLANAIASILTQTETDFEFLIIDDHSSDTSFKILSHFAKKDRRIRLFQNKQNCGLAKSLNTLIPNTRGKYVARMDGDDISLPNRFATQISYLEKHPDIVACGAQVELIDENGHTIGTKKFPTTPKKCRNWIMNFMVIQPPLLMARGDSMRKCAYDEKLFANDDIPLHFQLLQFGQLSNVDEILFQYRLLKNSLTHTNPKQIYFKALKVRLHAIKNGYYKPALLNALIAVFETIIITLLPNSVIFYLFSLTRHRKNKYLSFP